jgi:hypothetical protein
MGSRVEWISLASGRGGFNRPLLGLKAQAGILDGGDDCWFVDL